MVIPPIFTISNRPSSNSRTSSEDLKRLRTTSPSPLSSSRSDSQFPGTARRDAAPRRLRRRDRGGPPGGHGVRAPRRPLLGPGALLRVRRRGLGRRGRARRSRPTRPAPPTRTTPTGPSRAGAGRTTAPPTRGCWPRSAAWTPTTASASCSRSAASPARRQSATKRPSSCTTSPSAVSRPPRRRSQMRSQCRADR